MLTCSPLKHVFSLSGELHYPSIAVAVRDEDVPGLRFYRHVSGLAEVVIVASWRERLSKRQQHSVSAIAAHF